jgi:hypothetical protein
MKPAWSQIVLWLPRVLGMLFAGFLSIFALDVFSEAHGFLETVLHLLIHLMPSIIILGVVLIGFRWPLLAGVIFLMLGPFSGWFFGGFRGNGFAWVVCGALVVIGLAFLGSDWAARSRLSGLAGS